MSHYTAADAHAAVARGAAWLDEQCPNWPAEIDLDRLQLNDGYTCILGQTANCIIGEPGGTDDDGFSRVLDTFAPTGEDAEWAIGLGFDVQCNCRTAADNKARYEMLQIAWEECIRERLAVGVPQ